MFHFIVSLLFIVFFNDICFGAGWNPSNFSFNPGDNYELVWQDEFENVGPVRAIINGQPAYAPNPKNWVHIVGHNNKSLQNFTDSIQNAYVQNGKLKIVAFKEGYTSGMLQSYNLQEFTFGTFAAKIRLPYGQGICAAWWLLGNGDKYKLWWPTVGEIDILEMVGGNTRTNLTDQYAHATVHWNNQSNTMNPMYNKQLQFTWGTPDGSKLHDNSLVYWVEWTATNIRMGINEFNYYQLNTTSMPDSINPVTAFTGKWPFFMLLDISIGGIWAGPPDNTTVWPQEMVVDWVRVYQQEKTIIGK
jgi:beta-glucanase (GH16 family)